MKVSNAKCWRCGSQSLKQDETGKFTKCMQCGRSQETKTAATRLGDRWR